MLKNSFIHIPGIGFKTEQDIWRKGIFTWQQFLNDFKNIELPAAKKETIRDYLIFSIKHLDKKNLSFFTKTLPKSETWRAYPEFREKVAFVDIETTGLSPFYNEITVIGLYDGKNVKTFIAGSNLDDFTKEIKKYSLIVTFNGALFDLPFIKKKFTGFTQPAHIDLRFFLKRFGFSGGLKKIEKQFNIIRPKDMQEIDGFGATILWNRYVRGKIEALKLLLKYNMLDVINLKVNFPISVDVFNR